MAIGEPTPPGTPCPTCNLHHTDLPHCPYTPGTNQTIKKYPQYTNNADRIRKLEEHVRKENSQNQTYFIQRIKQLEDRIETLETIENGAHSALFHHNAQHNKEIKQLENHLNTLQGDITQLYENNQLRYEDAERLEDGLHKTITYLQDLEQWVNRNTQRR